jgi:hypothetical protein
MRYLFLALSIAFICFPVDNFAQVFINEGCNKNYQSIQDEDGDSPDWIELYNAGLDTIDLESYSISDDASFPKKWEFPQIKLAPNDFKVVFCSGKNRKGSSSFQFTLSQQNYNPIVGWNIHNLSAPFIWDGISNIIINICSYNNTQYTENSSVRQSMTSFPSTLVSFADGSPVACSTINGGLFSQRPNMKFNGIAVGDGTIINGNTEYPAPYGNWYWGARHQFLFLASELQAAGISAGPITSLGFDVAMTSSEFYNYVDFEITTTSITELTSEFLPTNGHQLHTNFKLDGISEKVYLYKPNELEVSRLTVESPTRDISIGKYTDGSTTLKWLIPSPGESNNSSITYFDTLKSPVISLNSGVYQSNQYVSIKNPNQGVATTLRYTIDGSTPSVNSFLYVDSILITSNTVLRAKVFPVNPTGGILPSDNSVATYLFDVSHTTPILLVTTDENNLYGPQGIFDNFNFDWKKPAHAAYLTEAPGHPIAFQTNAGMRPEGGAGGSRSQPQHSFRLSFADGALGEKPVEYPILPDRPNRTTYSDIYLRNGSNQFLTLPYKDASQVRMMSEGTKNYYSAYRPVTVYINGEYFGLYELREKFNKEYFQVHDGANLDSIELLSMSYFYNLVLRAVEGSVDHFYESYDSLVGLNLTDTNYLSKADRYFDMAHYTDYVIAESWMGNTDWPQNNIKIYRSDKTNNRWRFGLIDLELSLQPNGWTSCTDNHIRYMLDRDPSIPYINIWLRSINNLKYKNYFINRFADLMNTSYKLDVIQATEQRFYNGMFSEMPLEYERWGNPNDIQGQMQQFTQNHLTFKSELACRTNVVRNNLISEFQLDKKVTLNLNVFPDSTGKIKINTITPDTYPWSGIYFDGVPVKMTAIADSGYQFSHWEPNAFIADTLNPVIEENMSENKLFKAYFKAIPPKPDGPEIHFVLFPNPTSSELIIQHDNKTLAKGCFYEIYDLNGRKIAGGEINNNVVQTKVDVKWLRSSIYIVRIKQDEAILETIRFVKY